MTLSELKIEIEKYQYFEDTSVIDVALASIVAARLGFGDPIWLVVIGPSSGGKSQLLRPLALTDPKFLHRVDDLTENTFLSGMNLGKGKGEPSLLQRIGDKGILMMSDLTVLFSKNKEARGTILSQFRMIYDGEMVKHSGTSDKPIVWRGKLGVLAGSTPSIYQHFEEVADMGERFIYWRMKGFDGEKATRIAMSRQVTGKDLDERLGELYADFIKDAVKGAGEEEVSLSVETVESIIRIASFAERVRTVAHVDQFRDKVMDRIPVSAYPMRVSLQLTNIAKGLAVIRKLEKRELDGGDISMLEWLGWSLANEEKRACLRVLGGIDYGLSMSTSMIADEVGLATTVIRTILQNLASVGVLSRGGGGDALTWAVAKQDDWEIVRRVEGITGKKEVGERRVTSEEKEEIEIRADELFDSIKENTI